SRFIRETIPAFLRKTHEKAASLLYKAFSAVSDKQTSAPQRILKQKSSILCPIPVIKIIGFPTSAFDSAVQQDQRLILHFIHIQNTEQSLSVFHQKITPLNQIFILSCQY